MILGIDVSHHQDPTELPYQQLFQAGYKFLIARSSYGDTPDDTFVEHIRRAQGAGMSTGAYHFYRQTRPLGDQRRAWLEQLDRVQCELAPALDVEWNEDFDGKVDPQRFNHDCPLLLESVRLAHGGSGIYSAPGFYELLGSPRWFHGPYWWVSHWGTIEPYSPPGAPEWTIWQDTVRTGVGGYNKPLDLNRAKYLPVAPAPTRRSDASKRAKLYRKIARSLEELAELDE